MRKLLFLCVISGSWILCGTPHPGLASSAEPGTAGPIAAAWKAYKDPTYGFSFRYPPEGKLSAIGSSAVAVDFEVTTERGYEKVEENLSFVVKVNDNPSGLSPQGWAALAVKPAWIVRSATVHGSGWTGHQIMIRAGGRAENHILVAAGGRMVEISFPEPSSLLEFSPASQQSWSDLFQKMLHSLTLE